MTNYKFSEDVAILSVIDPDAYTAATYTGDYADVEYFEAFGGVLLVGTIAASGTVDFSLVQATSATGAGVKAITSASITQATTASNDKQYIINLRADQLDVANGFHFVAPKMIVGTAAADTGAFILGFKVKHGPASGHDLASVTSIITP